MSNHLAIATVTATLRHLLQTALVANDLSATVTTLRPERLAEQVQNAGVNIYLYHVTPNIALRNNDLPTRRADGRVLQHTQVALDLHYLLTFYGQEAELTPQRMLGTAVSALHSEAIIKRDMIRDTIVNAPQSPYLTESDLTEQPEQVKFTLVPLDLQGLHSLWSLFFPTPYYLSVAYKASVVLIDGAEIPQPALPVRDRHIVTEPFLAPRIEAVVSERGATAPIVAGDALLIRGQYFRGQDVAVRIGDTTVPPQSVVDQQIRLVLPDTLRPGVQPVQVVAASGIESNAAALVLRPTITHVEATAGRSADTVHLTIATRLRVGKAQRVVVLLQAMSEQAPAAYSFTAPARQNDGDPIVVAIRGVASGEYLVRVQVDGAESPLTFENSQYVGPEVTIP
jgi:hypothetical protein